MTRYNPDEVHASKVVHTDTFSEDTVTYGSLREQAGHAAWGLQRKLGLQPGNTLLALVNNSVRASPSNFPQRWSDLKYRMPLFFSLMRRGGQVLFSREYNELEKWGELPIVSLDLSIHQRRAKIFHMFSKLPSQHMLPPLKKSSAPSRLLWPLYLWRTPRFWLFVVKLRIFHRSAALFHAILPLESSWLSSFRTISWAKQPQRPYHHMTFKGEALRTYQALFAFPLEQLERSRASSSPITILSWTAS